MAIDITPTTILAPFEAEHQAVNLTRNNKGSRWDRIGNNELIASDKWRYNYNPLTGIYEGRTIMGQWTNEIQDPRDMTTGNWIKNNTNATRNAIGIDGEQNAACSIISTDDGSGDSIQQDITVPSDSNTHTIVTYVKKESDIEIWFFDNGMPNAELRKFDPSNGSVLEGSLNVDDYGYWWRCWFTTTNDGTATTINYRMYPRATTGTLIVDAAQVFLNRSSPPPTPVYGETAGQSCTQDPDIATVTDLDAINFNPSEGTFVVEYRFSTAPSDYNFLLELSEGNGAGGDPDITIRSNYAGGGARYIGRFSGGIQWNIGEAPTVSSGNIKLAVTYKDNDIAFSQNGVLVGTDSSANVNGESLNYLRVGSSNVGTKYLDGFIKELKYYPRRLSNEDLIQETTI